MILYFYLDWIVVTESKKKLFATIMIENTVNY